jgi:hypothetical protein
MSAGYPKTECFTLYWQQPKAAPMAIKAMNVTRDREIPLEAKVRAVLPPNV